MATEDRPLVAAGAEEVVPFAGVDRGAGAPSFKIAFEKDLLYKGNYPVHVCPHCATVVAYSEIEYKKVEDESVYVKFQVKNEEATYLLIWTTTPWTLPANTGIMANPNFDYSRIKVDGEILIIASNLVDKIMKKFNKINYSILSTVKGRELVELQYDNPMKDILPVQWNITGNVVLSEQYVTLDEGTGLVHTAPGHGKEDYKVGREFNLPALSPLNLDGTFTEDAGEFLYNKFARDANKDIIAKLEERGMLFGKEKITHDYPFCWRCGSQLLMLSVPQWFFKISAFRDKMIEENDKVKWSPDWAKKRFRNWLENLDDWPISRQRYWGIPLPIWICEKCNKIKVVGSYDDLPKKLKDYHKPYIDEVTLNCECGGVMRRIPDVLDVWFDSGVASWASLGYPRNKELFKELWPADLNIEGVDQMRGWWNSEIITSQITFGKKPFKSILTHGFVLDLSGMKMSKSKGNVVKPKEVLEKYGRDVLRYYLLMAEPGDGFYFDWTSVEKTLKFFTVFYNTVNFIETYCKKSTSLKKLKPEDKWILAVVNKLAKQVEEFNKNLTCNKSVEAIQNFVLEDFSRMYIKLIRDRVWPAYKGDDKEAAFATCYYVLEKVVKLLAPMCPFITENLYQKMFDAKTSIHLVDWPDVEKEFVNEKIEKEMDIARNIVEAPTPARHEENIKLRYVLQSLTVDGNDEVKAAAKDLKEIIEELANVKEVKVETLPGGKEFENGKLALDTDITEEIKSEWLLSELVRSVQDARKQMKLDIKDKVNLYLPDEKLFEENQKKIEASTSSKATFGKIVGDKFSLEFDSKKYEFGIKS